MADENDKPIPTTTGASTSTDDIADTPPEDTTVTPEGDLGGDDMAFDSAAGDGSASQTDQTGGTTSATVQSFRDTATSLTKGLGDKAKSYAEDGKARAGTALDDLVQMLHDAAGTVDEKIGAQYGQYARTAADTVSGFSESLKAKDVDDLIADASGFVKKSPAIAIGTAAALGFVLVRLVQSGLNADTDQV